jgi:hypothetical protein
MERSEAKRLRYTYHMGLMYQPEQFVFVDESAFDRRACYRGKAYALKGHRIHRKCFFIRGQRYIYLYSSRIVADVRQGILFFRPSHLMECCIVILSRAPSTHLPFWTLSLDCLIIYSHTLLQIPSLSWTIARFIRRPR